MLNDISKKNIFSDTDVILNLDTYDRFTYLISKFNKSNVYVKIRLTDFLYSSIFFDINNLVNISSRISKKNKIYNTIIPSSYLNNAVYALTNNNDLSNLSYVSRKILKLLKINNNEYNQNIDKEKLKLNSIYYEQIYANINNILVELSNYKK